MNTYLSRSFVNSMGYTPLFGMSKEEKNRKLPQPPRREVARHDIRESAFYQSGKISQPRYIQGGEVQNGGSQSGGDPHLWGPFSQCSVTGTPGKTYSLLRVPGDFALNVKVTKPRLSSLLKMRLAPGSTLFTEIAFIPVDSRFALTYDFKSPPKILKLKTGQDAPMKTEKSYFLDPGIIVRWDAKNQSLHIKTFTCEMDIRAGYPDSPDAHMSILSRFKLNQKNLINAFPAYPEGLLGTLHDMSRTIRYGDAAFLNGDGTESGIRRLFKRKPEGGGALEKIVNGKRQLSEAGSNPMPYYETSDLLSSGTAFDKLAKIEWPASLAALKPPKHGEILDGTAEINPLEEGTNGSLSPWKVSDDLKLQSVEPKMENNGGELAFAYFA